MASKPWAVAIGTPVGLLSSIFARGLTHAATESRGCSPLAMPAEADGTRVQWVVAFMARSLLRSLLVGDTS